MRTIIKKILGICAHEIYELIIKNRNIYFFDDKELYEKNGDTV